MTVLLAVLIGGCAHSTVHVRQTDGTIRTSEHLILRVPRATYRTFACSQDYMVACTHYGVTYEWPKGKGSFSEDFEAIDFRGDAIRCEVQKRRLSVNGQSFGDQREGDRVRITSGGRVFVNDAERGPVD